MHVRLQVLKENNKSRFDSYTVRNSVLIISHITFRDCYSRAHVFDNLSRMYIQSEQILLTSIQGQLKLFLDKNLIKLHYYPSKDA